MVLDFGQENPAASEEGGNPRTAICRSLLSTSNEMDQTG